MSNFTSTDELFLTQWARYPAAQARDLVKCLYQSVFGCGHLVSDSPEGLAWLLREAADCAAAPRGEAAPLVESLGNFSRVHLAGLHESGLSAETLFRLFVRSSAAPTGNMSDLSRGLDRLEELIRAGRIPLDAGEAARFLAEYREAGCPATHHSQAFRDAYAPAYRVIWTGYARLLPLFRLIDRRMGEKGRAVVAIEGRCAAGKSSLAALIASIYGCPVFHMDDFFLQPHQRTPERFAQSGGNVDWERFDREVLIPLKAGIPFEYRPFDCHRMDFAPPVAAAPGALAVVEGSYCMHPALAGRYDASVFLDIDPDAQRARILRRNGETMLRRFEAEWIPLEERYFAATDARGRCDAVLDMEDAPEILFRKN